MSVSGIQAPPGRLDKSIPIIKIAALAVILFLLFPPAAIDGLYSPLEAAIALLVFALLPETPSRDRVFAVPTALILLVALMGLSAVWSVTSLSTVRDATTYAVLTLAAILLARSLSLARIAAAIVLMGSTVLVLSAGAVLLRPEIAIDSSGLLQGIYGNRNGLGYVAVQMLPALIALPLRTRFATALRLLAIALVLWAIVATGSRTALITAVCVLAAWGAILVIRRWNRTVWGIGALVVAAAVAAVVNQDRLLVLLGKDSTGSGRTEIWEALLPVVGERPILGAGWARSWPVGSPQYEAMIEAFGRPFFHAHNEVLNWLVTVGAIGLLLVVGVYVVTVWTGWRAWADGTPASSFVILAVVMTVARGLTEISETSAQGWLVLALAAAAGAQYVAASGRPVSPALLVRWPRQTPRGVDQLT